jgi:hypothetical protein
MIITKECRLGKINIEIPINAGDIILQGRTEYRINRFVIVENKIFAVNTSSGLWANIEELEFIQVKNKTNYYKIITEEK